jgi:hypothetical protein
MIGAHLVVEVGGYAGNVDVERVVASHGCSGLVDPPSESGRMCMCLLV